MIDVKEVLRRRQAGQSTRRIARETGLDRKTVTRYVQAASREDVPTNREATSDETAAVRNAVQARAVAPPSTTRSTLERWRARIEHYLGHEPPLTMVRIHELMTREGVVVSYSALRRFAHGELGWRETPLTVRVDDPPPGQEAQVDFGHMGYLTEETGKRRKLWALLVTLSHSRYQFVWPTLTQTTRDVIDGLEAAWRFFGGIPHRIVPDNASSMIVRAHPTSPTVHPAFLEYAQVRGFFVDAARVRKPKDKPRVENQVAYVRERCFAGERFLDVQDARKHAEQWCRDVAGTRVHGTTRAVPRDVYESIERAHMLAAPTTRYDTPTWSQAKVHPDHHAQVAAALYSLPTALVGKTLSVRVDSKDVRFYLHGKLVKLHPRVAKGKRSTDASDYPAHKTAYALRSIDGVKRRACELGDGIGRFATELLKGPLPWTRMRAAYGLLRLCDKYGATRVEPLCVRALEFEVLDVGRIEHMLKQAIRVDAQENAAAARAALPSRFARDAASFATRLPLSHADARITAPGGVA